MSEFQDNPQNEEYEDEIDFLAIFKRLLQKKVFIAKIAVICAVVGFFVAVFSPKKYKAECIFFPQTGNNQSGGNISSLASLAGFNLGGASSQSGISPNLYPFLLKNEKLMKDLIYSEVYFPDLRRRQQIYDYYTDSTRNKVSVSGTLKKYTIGLPKTIAQAVRGNAAKTRTSNVLDFLDTSSIVLLSPKERMCIGKVNGMIKMEVDQKKNNIKLSAASENPYVAAQIADITFRVLQNYVISFRTQKAQDQLDYLEKIILDAKVACDSIEIKYAEHLDSHRFQTSKVASVESIRLKNQYELAQGVYKNLCAQKEQARLRVREDTPVLVLVKPITIPSSPMNMGLSKILLISMFIGLVIASAMVLFFDFLKNNGMSYPAGWHNQEEDDEAERKILESGLVPDSFWKKFFSKKLFV